MEETLLYIIKNNIKTYVCVVNNIITAFDMMQYESSRKYNSLKQAYIAAYCIYNNPTRKSKNLCWYCNNIHTYNNIYLYETIQNTYIALHKHCYEQAAAYRKKCNKKVVEQYQLLLSNNYCIMYNYNELYYIIHTKYNMVPYNALIKRSTPYPKEEDHQLPYQRLVKKLFIQKHVIHFILINRFTFEEIYINKIINTFYVNIIMI